MLSEHWLATERWMGSREVRDQSMSRRAAGSGTAGNTHNSIS